MRRHDTVVLRFLQPGLALSNGFIQESAAAKMFFSHSPSLGHYLRWAWLLMDRSCTKSPHLHTFAIKRTKLRTCWPTVTFTSFNLAFNPITLTSRVEFSWPEIYVFLKEPRHENTSDLLEQCPIPFRTSLFTTSNNFRITRLKSVLCVPKKKLQAVLFIFKNTSEMMFCVFPPPQRNVYLCKIAVSILFLKICYRKSFTVEKRWEDERYANAPTLPGPPLSVSQDRILVVQSVPLQTWELWTDYIMNIDETHWDSLFVRNSDG